MNTIRKSYERSAALVTRFIYSGPNEPIWLTSLKIAGLFLLVSFIVSVMVSAIVDPYLKAQIYQATLIDASKVDPAEMANIIYDRTIHDLSIWRTTRVIVSAIAGYVLVWFALRPVKRNNDLQRRFASIVSHELRTPVAVMRSEFEVALRSNDIPPEKARALIQSGNEEVTKLNEITDFLLVYSGIKDRDRAFNLHDIRLRIPVQKAVEDVSFTSIRKISFKNKLDPEFKITGNKTAIYLLVVNLLNNSVRNTPANRSISVELAHKNGKPMLSVIDEGRGFSASEKANIFEPFYKGTNHFNAVQGSIGIGLSIVKEIADMHGAKIQVDSTEGEGTRIDVIFKPAIS